MRRVLRLVFIVYTMLRFGLDEVALSSFRQRWIRALGWTLTLGRRFDQPRGVRLRLAMERLGPIFVKFGQVLSTRRDLLPLDVSDELAKLQDRVPPIPAAQAAALVHKAFGRPTGEVFASFEPEPVASASIAQVHFATMQDGREVAVKVLRPGMLEVIDSDLNLLHTLALLRTARCSCTEGSLRPSRGGDKRAGLAKITTVNGLDPEQIRNRPKFGDLTPVYPNEPLRMEHAALASLLVPTPDAALVGELGQPLVSGQRGLAFQDPGHVPFAKVEGT